jgi:hypothetical protein
MKNAVLVFEGFLPLWSEWRPIASQRFGDPPATISHNHAEGRDVYVTRVYQDHATLATLGAGTTLALGDGARLVVELEAATVWKRLEIGESIQLMLKPDRAPVARHVRYRCVSV